MFDAMVDNDVSLIDNLAFLEWATTTPNTITMPDDPPISVMTIPDYV